MPRRNKPTLPLTIREQRFLQALAKGNTYTDAAKAAGYSAKWAGSLGYQAMQSIQRKMPEALRAYGLTPDRVVKKYLIPALNAQETKFAQFEGKFSDRREVVAWEPRLKALDMLFKLSGDYQTTPEKSTDTQITIRVQFDSIDNQQAQQSTTIIDA